MADSTENETNRVTSGRRVLIAAWIRQATDLLTLYSVAWAEPDHDAGVGDLIRQTQAE